MALTATNQPDGFNIFGTVPVQFATLTFDATPPAGGYPINGQLFGLGSGAGTASSNGIRGVDFIGGNTASAGYVFAYNYQTGTVGVFETAATPTAAAPLAAVTTTLATVSVNVIIYAYAE